MTLFGIGLKWDDVTIVKVMSYHLYWFGMECWNILRMSNNGDSKLSLKPTTINLYSKNKYDIMVTPTFGNLYPGLFEGPIRANASVINAINGGSVAFIGSVVEVDPISQGTPPGSLLPEVSITAIQGFPTYGIEVGGVRKGVYGVSAISFKSGINLNDPGLIALFREAVRVCTEGICLANVLTRTSSDIQLGDPLTADAFSAPDFSTFGFLAKAQSGDFVIARALQPIPVGTPDNPQARVAAVNVQREGILP